MDSLPIRDEEALKRQYENNRPGRENHSTLREFVAYPKPSEMWPTPTKHNAQENGSPSQISRNTIQLGDLVKRWPTPTANSPLQKQNGPNGHSGIYLNGAVNMWPTPKAMDTSRRIASENWRGDDLVSTVNKFESIPGSLNPSWVELLMGWPKHWTALDPISKDVFNSWRDSFMSDKAKKAWQNGEWEIGTERLATNIKGRVDRLKAIGNGQVPKVAAMAWNILKSRMEAENVSK